MRKSLPSLGWQSWSPPYPHRLKFPSRDYNPKKNHSSLPTGKFTNLSFTYWCSWYALGAFINPQNLLNQASLIKKHHLPIQYFLIDDGWHEAWLKDLTSELHRLGFKVGLWYAPFTKHKHLPLRSTLHRLILVNKLDLLKLDFLYKPYFSTQSANPSQTLQDLFIFLSNEYPQLRTIGCGVPFIDAIGQVDTIRLSKDTAFPPYLPLIISKLIYQHRVSMLSEKYQAWNKHPLFVPDPDVRMFSLDSPLTNNLWSKMTYQIKGLGDDLSSLSPAQLNEARIWLKK